MNYDDCIQINNNQIVDILLPITDKCYNVHLCTRDTDKPIVAYLKFKSKILPTTNKKNYYKDITSAMSNFKQWVNDSTHGISSIDKKRILSECIVSEKNLKYNHVSNLKIDIFYKLIGINDINTFIPNAISMAESICKDVTKNLNTYGFDVI